MSTEPADPYFVHRKNQAATMQPHRPYEKCDTLKQFLDNDRKVLRFYCIWDNSSEMFGDVRELVLHYFLADDTIEIREVIRANSGRDAAPKFLRRSKVPKEVGALHKPGEITERTILNVFGPMGHGGRYILDSLKTGAVDKSCYTDADLTIGAKVNVWGREVTVCDMDEFTAHHYASKFSVAKNTPIHYKQTEAAKIEREIPPYNGWGSEEDSRANCLKLIAQAPKRDFIKFMKKDRQGLDSHVLRFFARLDTNRPIDMDRTFIISFFLSDDTISVFEPEKRNSGIVHGKFIERSKIMNPSGGYYQAEDIYVGAVVNFRSHQFVITDADEYALSYAEQHKFPEADLTRIMDALCDSIPENVLNEEFAQKESVSYVDFVELIEASSHMKLSQHAILVIARKYANESALKITYDLVLKLCRYRLQKMNFDRYDELRKALSQCPSEDNDNLIDPADVYRVCAGVGLPLKNDLLTALIQKVPKPNGRVDYKSFVEELNSIEAAEENVPFIPDSRLTVPDEEKSGWFGLRNFHCSPDAIPGVNIKSFYDDLVALKQAQAQSLSPKPKSVHFS
ncbi:EF-hand domain-containing family member C2-like [Bolinopsis microptera]|uniref:EF-hand domain-containing family member C2-like n=1 Tax=Bolinopsis microptera TaxID=2820187 RepID=UPI003079A2E7